MRDAAHKDFLIGSYTRVGSVAIVKLLGFPVFLRVGSSRCLLGVRI